MTLILSLEGEDGLILACDSRGTIGDPRGLTAVNDLQQKLFKLSDKCGIAISGASELASRLIDRVITSLNLIETDEILGKVAEICKSEYQSWFGGRPWATPQAIIDQRPPIFFIMAGYSRSEKGEERPRIYMLASQLDFAPQLCQSGFMMAGIPQYATYLVHKFYDRKMGLPSLKALAAYLITETASQDPKVGGPIKMAQITKEGFVELEKDEIDIVAKRNEELSKRMKEFFLKGGR